MKYIALVSTLNYWVVVATVLRKWGVSKHKTISDHVASEAAKKLYTPVTLILLSIYLIFLVDYFIPEFRLGPVAYIVSLAAWFFQIMTILFIRKPPLVLVHDLTAALSGGSLFVLLLLTWISPIPTDLAKFFVAFALLYMLTIGPLLLNKNKKNYLLYQIIYFASFHLAILAVIFL